jgi:adenylate kinase
VRSTLITGVQGVGKSTVSRLAAHTLDLESWDYADLMLRVAPDLKNKDAIHDLPWERRRQIYGKVDELLAKYFNPGDGRSECVLLENHLSILDDQGLRTFPHDAIPRYNPVALVIVEANPRQILERRRNDPRRNRHCGTVDGIIDQQFVNRREAALIAKRFELALRVLNNDDGDAQSSAHELSIWLAKVLP